MIVGALRKRIELSLRVGAYKQEHEKPIYRREIEDERVRDIQIWAKENGLNPHFVHSILYLVIDESCKNQMIQLQEDSKSHEIPVNDEERYKLLKENLLALTALCASEYDEHYSDTYFATQTYLDFEDRVVEEVVQSLGHKGTFIDIGCATGRRTIPLSHDFERSVGYDISPQMVEVALQNGVGGENLEFRRVDVEHGIPEEDESVSFVLMNLGTGSDMKNIADVLSDIRRILRPDGKFVFSFYNADALVYRGDFIPWPVSLAAEINLETHHLDVHHHEKTFQIYARPYSLGEVRNLLSEEFVVSRTATYPTLSSVLPNVFFGDEFVQKAITDIDSKLINDGLGAYIIATGKKKSV